MGPAEEVSKVEEVLVIFTEDEATPPLPGEGSGELAVELEADAVCWWSTVAFREGETLLTWT